MALFVKLDVTWLDSRKILFAPMAVRGCHATALCLAKRTEADGWFHRGLLTREGANEAIIDDAIARGLLDVDGDLLRPSDWLDRNPSQADLDARRASKKIAGKKGNHVRHGHDGPVENCRTCFPNGLVAPTILADRSHTVSGCEATVSPDLDLDLESDLRRSRVASDVGTIVGSADPVARIRSQERGSPDAAKVARSAIRAVGETDNDADRTEPAQGVGSSHDASGVA